MTAPLDLESLADIGLSPTQLFPLKDQLAECQALIDDPIHPMRVVEVQRDHVLLHDGHHTHRASPSNALQAALQAQFDALAVGDWVLARLRSADNWQAVELLPRHSQVSRRTNDGRGGVQRQVLVANVNSALLVMGLDHDFNLRRLERYLMLVQLAGIGAVLVLTKADCVDAAATDQRLAAARALLPTDVPCLAVDGRDPSTAQRLGEWLPRGATVVLLGSSGAGKSTLTNTLLAAHGVPGPAEPSATAAAMVTDSAVPRCRVTPAQVTRQRSDNHHATGAVRQDDSRGRHTTTHRSLHCTPGGACIIDTPGLRALRLDIDSRDDLAGAFGDVERAASGCRFRDCRHQSEPGCAVREAIEPERLRNFQKLLREAQRDSRSALERIEQVAQWKVRHRAALTRMRVKRGAEADRG